MKRHSARRADLLNCSRRIVILVGKGHIEFLCFTSVHPHLFKIHLARTLQLLGHEKALCNEGGFAEL